MVLVVLLAACAQTADYERPALPVPPQWPQGSDAAGQQVAAQLQWRHYFVDPRLQVLIATALDNNRDLRIATQRVLEARAQYRITDADRFPSINLAGSLQAGQTPADLSGTGTVINGQRFDLALTNVAYEADFWGRLASLSEAATRNFLATEEARRSYQLSLIGEVAATYFAQLQCDELVRLAQEAVGSREASLAVVEKGRSIGAADDFEYLQARAALENAHSELANWEQQRNVARNKLNFLIGAVPQDLPAGLDLDHQGLDSVLAPGLPSLRGRA